MAYSYYQQTYPGWGTSQFQMGPPPAPSFQPDPAWGGYDYYRAHAVNPSRSLFHSILDRVRGGSSSNYISTHEARSIHTRVYGGFLSLDRVMPSEIGSAAAYEAYRTWKYHGSILQPLGGQYEREREALVGLALAETSHIWQYTGRSSDTYGLQDALETAALTAMRLYERKAGRSIQDASTIATAGLSGLGGGVGVGGEPYARDYAYSRPRRYSSSVPTVIRAGSASPYVGGTASLGGTPYAGNLALPGTSISSGYASSIPGSSPYVGGVALPGTATTGYGVQPQVVMPQVTTGAYGYAQQQQPIVIQPQQSYGTGYGGYGHSGYGYGGSYGGYGHSGYGGSSRPIIIDASSSGRRHHHHHHRDRDYYRDRDRDYYPRYRSRSSDPVSRHRHHRY